MRLYKFLTLNDVHSKCFVHETTFYVNKVYYFDFNSSIFFQKNVPSFQILVNSVNFLWFWHGFQQTKAPCLHFHLGIQIRKITHVCTVFSGKYKRGIPIPIKQDSLSAVWCWIPVNRDSSVKGLIFIAWSKTIISFFKYLFSLKSSSSLLKGNNLTMLLNLILL